MPHSALFPPLGRSLALIVLLLLALPSALSAQELRPFTVEDALRVSSVSIADVSEDARWIAATVSTSQSRMNSDHFRYGDPTYVGPSLVDVMVLDAETGASFSVFDSPAQVTGFAWSPEGDRLAFRRMVEGDVRLEIWDRDSKRVQQVRLRPQRELAWGGPWNGSLMGVG